MKKKQRQVGSGIKLSESSALQIALSSSLPMSLFPLPAVIIVSLVPVCSSPNLDCSSPNLPPADDPNFLTLHLHVTILLVPAYP